MKVHVGEFLALTAVLASAGLVAPGCGTEKVSENPRDSGAGASGGDGGGGGSSGSDGGGSGGGGSGGDGGTRGDSGPGADAAAGSDAGTPDASSAEGGVGDAMAEGAADTAPPDGDTGDGGPSCFGDETTLTTPDAGIEGFSHCLDLPSGSCEGVSNPLADVCGAAEFDLRPGVFQAVLECLQDIDVASGGDAGDAGNPFCLISTSEAATACRTNAIANACPLDEVPDAGVEGGTGLDCASIAGDCEDVTEEQCAAVEGALLDLPLSAFPTCYSSSLTFLECGEAFDRCVTNPFAE